MRAGLEEGGEVVGGNAEVEGLVRRRAPRSASDGLDAPVGVQGTQNEKFRPRSFAAALLRWRVDERKGSTPAVPAGGSLAGGSGNVGSSSHNHEWNDLVTPRGQIFTTAALVSSVTNANAGLREAGGGGDGGRGRDELAGGFTGGDRTVRPPVPHLHLGGVGGDAQASTLASKHSRLVTTTSRMRAHPSARVARRTPFVLLEGGEEGGDAALGTEQRESVDAAGTTAPIPFLMSAATPRQRHTMAAAGSDAMGGEGAAEGHGGVLSSTPLSVVLSVDEAESSFASGGMGEHGMGLTPASTMSPPAAVGMPPHSPTPSSHSTVSTFDDDEDDDGDVARGGSLGAGRRGGGLGEGSEKASLDILRSTPPAGVSTCDDDFGGLSASEENMMSSFTSTATSVSLDDSSSVSSSQASASTPWAFASTGTSSSEPVSDPTGVQQSQQQEQQQRRRGRTQHPRHDVGTGSSAAATAAIKVRQPASVGSFSRQGSRVVTGRQSSGIGGPHPEQAKILRKHIAELRVQRRRADHRRAKLEKRMQQTLLRAQALPMWTAADPVIARRVRVAVHNRTAVLQAQMDAAIEVANVLQAHEATLGKILASSGDVAVDADSIVGMDRAKDTVRRVLRSNDRYVAARLLQHQTASDTQLLSDLAARRPPRIPTTAERAAGLSKVLQAVGVASRGLSVGVVTPSVGRRSSTSGGSAGDGGGTDGGGHGAAELGNGSSHEANLMRRLADPNLGLFRTRRYRFTQHQACASGREIVDTVLRHEWYRSRRGAVRACERLCEVGLLWHVGKLHGFQDKSYLYQHAGEADISAYECRFRSDSLSSPSKPPPSMSTPIRDTTPGARISRGQLASGGSGGGGRGQGDDHLRSAEDGGPATALMQAGGSTGVAGAANTGIGGGGGGFMVGSTPSSETSSSVTIRDRVSSSASSDSVEFAAATRLPLSSTTRGYQKQAGRYKQQLSINVDHALEAFEAAALCDASGDDRRETLNEIDVIKTLEHAARRDADLEAHRGSGGAGENGRAVGDTSAEASGRAAETVAANDSGEAHGGHSTRRRSQAVSLDASTMLLVREAARQGETLADDDSVVGHDADRNEERKRPSIVVPDLLPESPASGCSGGGGGVRRRRQASSASVAASWSVDDGNAPVRHDFVADEELPIYLYRFRSDMDRIATAFSRWLETPATAEAREVDALIRVQRDAIDQAIVRRVSVCTAAGAVAAATGWDSSQTAVESVNRTATGVATYGSGMGDDDDDVGGDGGAMGVVSNLLYFSEALVNTLCGRYGVEREDETRALEMLVQGHVFGKLGPAHFEHVARACEVDDALFRYNSKWVSDLPPTAFDIDLRFCPPNGADARRNFAQAVACLADVELLTVPGDMLLCIFETARLIFAEGCAYKALDQGVLGADSFVPLLVLVVAYARLSAPKAVLEYIKNLSPLEDMSSELGYYLVCLEVAVSFLTTIDATDYTTYLSHDEAAAHVRRAKDIRGGGLPGTIVDHIAGFAILEDYAT